MITTSAFLKAILIFVGLIKVAKLLEHTMFKRLRNNGTYCDAPKIISGYRFGSSILQLGRWDCIATTKC